MTIHEFDCADCGHHFVHMVKIGGTGYASTDDGGKICYECCGRRDRVRMKHDGKICLYLTKDKDNRTIVCNWPGTLKIPVQHKTTGRHNWARVRYDVWFLFDKSWWHGTQYGDNTMLCHCKRRTT